MAKGDHLSLVTPLDAALHDSGNQLLRHAKNLAWELKNEAPLFENDTLDRYWDALPRGTKLRYIGAVEMLVCGMINDINRDQAFHNATKLWLHQLLE